MLWVWPIFSSFHQSHLTSGQLLLCVQPAQTVGIFHPFGEPLQGFTPVLSFVLCTCTGPTSGFLKEWLMAKRGLTPLCPLPFSSHLPQDKTQKWSRSPHHPSQSGKRDHREEKRGTFDEKDSKTKFGRSAMKIKGGRMVSSESPNAVLTCQSCFYTCIFQVPGLLITIFS